MNNSNNYRNNIRFSTNNLKKLFKIKIIKLEKQKKYLILNINLKD